MRFLGAFFVFLVKPENGRENDKRTTTKPRLFGGAVPTAQGETKTKAASRANGWGVRAAKQRAKITPMMA